MELAVDYLVGDVGSLVLTVAEIGGDTAPRAIVGSLPTSTKLYTRASLIQLLIVESMKLSPIGGNAPDSNDVPAHNLDTVV